MIEFIGVFNLNLNLRKQLAKNMNFQWKNYGYKDLFKEMKKQDN